MRVHVVSGLGRGPTETAAYDAALADAGVHNYNLVPVSSVLPADAAVESVDTVPSLGPAGARLTVVQSRSSSRSGRIVAGLGWATGPGPGIVYEAAGRDPETVRRSIRRGLDAGCALRDWTLDDHTIEVRSAVADRGTTLELDGGERAPPRTGDAGGPADDGDGDGDGVVVGDPRHACVVYLAAYGDAEPIE
jgi:arginine decarboxylase